MRGLFGLAVLAGIGAFSVDAHSQKTDYPARSIRLVVPIAPGGGIDIVARALSQKLSESFRQTIVVDNRAGAGGLVGASTLVHAEPDAYTMGVVSGSFTTNAAIYRLDYDPLGDVTLVSLIGESGYLVTVLASNPIKNIKELVSYARQNPGKVNYGSSGHGGATHLTTELFAMMAGVKMTQVAYKGGGPAATALLGGEVQLLFGSMAATLPHLKAGRMRGIAITTLNRSGLLPEIPTVAESGVAGYETLIWYGVLGPKRIPQPIVARWSGEISNILGRPEMKERMTLEGLEIPDTSPAYFNQVLRRDLAKWTQVVKAARIEVAQ